MGTVGSVEMEWFQKDEFNIVPDSYKFEYTEDSLSYQHCTAIAPLYSTKNGVAVDEDMKNINKKYWLAKEGIPVTISTGFRVWDDGTEDEWERAADAKPVQYKMWDFGIKKPEETYVAKSTFLIDG